MARILVIEDDEPVRGMLRRMLEGAGYEVEEAPDGEEGIAHFQRDPTDLVVTDILLPKKDGVEVIRTLRHDFPAVKIIAITGIRGRYNRLPAASNLGARRTLMKPFTVQEVLTAVREVLEQD